MLHALCYCVRYFPQWPINNQAYLMSNNMIQQQCTLLFFYTFYTGFCLLQNSCCWASQRTGKDFNSPNLNILRLTDSKSTSSCKFLKAARAIALGYLAEVLSKCKACTLPPRCTYNCGIDLLPGPTRGRLYLLMVSAPHCKGEWMDMFRRTKDLGLRATTPHNTHPSAQQLMQDQWGQAGFDS